MRRSVLTSIRPVPAARASGSSPSESSRRCGSSKRAAALADVDAARGAQQRLELLAVDRPLLGQEVEDAAAVVVDDDDPDRGRDLAQGGEAADVVEEAEVAGDDRGRAAAGVGGADAGGDQAVDAVGAAVAEEERVGLVRAPGRPPGRGSACSRRCRRGRRRGGRARAPDAGRALRSPPSPRQLRLQRRPRCRARPRSRPPEAARSSLSSRAAQPAASSVGSARSIAAARRLGSFQPP